MCLPCLPESSSHLLHLEKPERPSCLFQTHMPSCFTPGPHSQAQLLSTARVHKHRKSGCWQRRHGCPPHSLVRILACLRLLSPRTMKMVAFKEKGLFKKSCSLCGKVTSSLPGPEPVLCSGNRPEELAWAESQCLSPL